MKKLLLIIVLLTSFVFPQQIKYVPVSIDSNASISAAVDLGSVAYDVNQKLIGIITPSTWTTANLTFQSYDENSGSWVNVMLDDGTELTYTATTSDWIIAKPTHFAGIRYLKIRSGTSGTPVNQANRRTLILIIREY